MRPIRLLVVASWFVNLAVVGAVLFSASGVRAELSQQMDVVSRWMVIGVFALLASVPWLYAYARAKNPDREGGSMAIGLISLGAPVLLIHASSAPAEGLGYYVLFYLLIVWATFATVAAKG